MPRCGPEKDRYVCSIGRSGSRSGRDNATRVTLPAERMACAERSWRLLDRAQSSRPQESPAALRQVLAHLLEGRVRGMLFVAGLAEESRILSLCGCISATLITHAAEIVRVAVEAMNKDEDVDLAIPYGRC